MAETDNKLAPSVNSDSLSDSTSLESARASNDRRRGDLCCVVPLPANELRNTLDASSVEVDSVLEDTNGRRGGDEREVNGGGGGEGERDA